MYQATPAHGTDGQNILKLVPVPQPRGHRPRITEPKRHFETGKAEAMKVTSAPVQTTKMEALHPLSSQQVATQQVLLGKNMPNLTVSASTLPQDTKKQTPSASSTVGPGSHSVSSPISSVNKGQSNPVLHSVKTASKTSGSQKNLMLTVVPSLPR